MLEAPSSQCSAADLTCSCPFVCCLWTLASPLDLVRQGIDRSVQALIAYLFIIINSSWTPRKVVRRLFPSAASGWPRSVPSGSFDPLAADRRPLILLVAFQSSSTGARRGTPGEFQFAIEYRQKLQRVRKLVRF